MSNTILIYKTKLPVKPILYAAEPLKVNKVYSGAKSLLCKYEPTLQEVLNASKGYDATKIKISCSDDDEICVDYIDYKEVPNPNYELQLRSYNQEMTEYKAKMKEYRKKLKQAKADREAELELYEKNQFERLSKKFKD